MHVKVIKNYNMMIFSINFKKYTYTHTHKYACENVNTF